MNIKFLKWNDNKDTIPGSEQAHHSKQMFEYVIRAFFTIIAYLLQQVTCLGLAATLWEPNDTAEVLAVQGALDG